MEKMFISTSIIEFTDYLMTVLLAVILVAMPFGIILFYGLLNFNKLDNPTFKQTYGSIYEGLKSTEYSSLAFNIVFVLRRILLAVTCLYLENSIWLQVQISLYVTLLTASYLLHFMPFEAASQQRLEVFNEITTILLLATTYTLAELPRNYEDVENEII